MSEKVAIGPPASRIVKYLDWPTLHLWDAAHTDPDGARQAGMGLPKHPSLQCQLTGSTL
ncbi:hypothetical protein [Rhodoferax lithotrophicus]|uniref:hypothetical protein n=1 Tax=Rhodoferax lithotrophicus TaxID=2798804 RepID=UPI001CC78006|nr:hypothetical protein [Rhodoferax sp. MIZ03]